MPSDRITQFYEAESLVLFGLSKTRKNFAWAVYNAMVKSGKRVFPIHPDGGSVRNVQFYNSIKSLPQVPKAAVLCLNLKKHHAVLPELKASGIKDIWFQQGSYDKSILREAEREGLNPITGCTLMYLPGTSFLHRLHRFFHEFFTKGSH